MSGLQLIPSLVGFAFSTAISLDHSQPAAEKVALLIRDHVEEDFLRDHGTEMVSEDFKRELNGAIAKFTYNLFDELGNCDLYFISGKRLYNTKGLIFTAEKMLPETVINEVSEQCKRDIQEAGRAIAFDLPTAAGFYISRALEDVVLMYFPVLGLTPLDEAARSLGNYTKLLKGEKVSGQQLDQANVVEDRITGLLGYFKDEYRNPLMHPELVLSGDEALDLFQAVLSTISIIVTDILKRKPKSEAEPEEGK